MKNIGGGGFENVSKEKISISAKAEPEKIAEAINEAFSKCE